MKQILGLHGVFPTGSLTALGTHKVRYYLGHETAYIEIICGPDGVVRIRGMEPLEVRPEAANVVTVRQLGDAK